MVWYFSNFILLVINQFYDAEITKEYVMRGNSAIIKCLIPSFVADFVQVVAWINEDKEEIISSKESYGEVFFRLDRKIHSFMLSVYIFLI